jgi:type I restriction enzyme, S subunit
VTIDLVSLKDVLRLSIDSVPVDPSRTYPIAGVYSFGRGLLSRAPLSGSETTYKTLNRLHCDDFVLSQLKGWEGALARVTPSYDGWFLSPQFPTFRAIPDRLDISYLDWYCKQAKVWDELRSTARGMGARRDSVSPERFLSLEIPLPSLPEQRRIVARIEELAAKINEARGLRERSVKDAEVLVSRTTSAFVDDAGWLRAQLGDVLTESPRNGLSPQHEVETGGRGMLRINAVSSSPTRFVDLAALKMVEVSSEEAVPFELRYDDIFIVRYNGDINRVAKAAIYKGGEPSGIIFPDKLMRLRPDQSKMLPEFLVYALGSRRVRQQIERLGKTTAGNIGISGANAKSFHVPVPPIQDQRRIVEKLDAVQSHVDRLKKLQVESAVELDALLPSVLDKAFKSEL